MTEHSYSAGLGLLKILPREIRDKIYVEVLTLEDKTRQQQVKANIACRARRIDFSSPTYKYKTGIGLLCSSHIIYDEALPALFQSNAFTIMITTNILRWKQEIHPYESTLTYASSNRWVIIDSKKQDMWHHMRNVILFIPINDARLSDYQSSRETSCGQAMSQEADKSFMDVMEETCSTLQKCINLNELLVKTHTFCGVVDEKLFGPVLKLRECKRTEIWVSGSGGPVPQLAKVCGDDFEAIYDSPKSFSTQSPGGLDGWQLQEDEIRSRLTFFDWNICLRRTIGNHVVTISNFVSGVSN